MGQSLSSTKHYKCNLNRLKIRFTQAGQSGQVLATKVGPLNVDKGSSVIIRDPEYRRFVTEDLVQFTSTDTAMLEIPIGQYGGDTQRLTSMLSIHGTPLPSQELSLMVHSLLMTENSHGCSCPAVLGHESPNTTAVVVYRGACTFFEKALNAHGAARLVIVIDQTEQEIIRPVLLDAAGRPMSGNDAYPSLVMVQGQAKAAYLQHGKKIKVRVNRAGKDTERLLIRGQQIENVEIKVEG